MTRSYVNIHLQMPYVNVINIPLTCWREMQ